MRGAGVGIGLLLGIGATVRLDAQVDIVFVGGACMVADTTLTATAAVPPWRALCPVILYNPKTLFALPGPVALYVIHHEGGHLALGHGARPEAPPRDRPGWQTWADFVRGRELEADCHAARTLRASKWPDVIEAVAAALDRTPDTTSGTGPAPSLKQIATELRRCG
jgi:hypothetical protein